MLQYHQSDELDAWQATILASGVNPDFSSGYTFKVVVKNAAGTTVLTKTTGITGASGGVITVAWAAGELNIAPGLYTAHLIRTRTSGTLEGTTAEDIEILPRNDL